MFIVFGKLRFSTEVIAKKWESDVGVCITSIKEDDSLELRQEISSGQFAIVKLHGEDSKVEVLEETGTSNYNVAEKRFSETSGKLGYEIQPLKDMKYPF